MRKRIVTFLMLLIAFVGVNLTGCSVFQQSGTRITVSSDEITIRLDEEKDDGSEVNTATFTITVDNFDNSHISFRIENEGVVTYSSVRKIDRYDVTVTGVKAGQAKLIAFLAENSKVSKEIIVNVVRPIRELSVKQDYIHYVAMGQKNMIKVSDCIIISPIDGDASEIKYYLQENYNSLNVTVNEITGEIDATNATSSGEIVVRAKVNDNVYTDILVKVIKAVDSDSISISRKYALDSEPLMVYDYGEQVYNTIPMVKTIEYYSEVEFEITYDMDLIDQKLNVTKAGQSIAVQKLTDDKILVKSVGLGKSKITFEFSILGAEDFIGPTIVEFEMNVIESPYDINLNGESAKECNNVFEKSIFNRYATGDYGMAFRFTLSPSSLLEENSDITIEFLDPSKAKNALIVLDSEGNRLGYDVSGVNFTGIFQIKAGETIYIKSTLNEVSTVSTYSFKATADITNTYNKGELVYCQVNLNVYEGITELTTANNKYYLAMGDEQGQSIILGTGNMNGDTSQITYSIENDKIRVSKVTNTNYIVYGAELGESSITFDSGNGYVLTIRFTIYGELTGFKVKTQNQYENGYIGSVEYDNLQSLSKIYVKTKGGFPVEIETNAGATVGKIKYEVNEQSQGYVSISGNYISVLGTGKATVTVYVFGYNEFGLVDEGDAFRKSFVVQGYVPINEISLNVTAKTLKDYTTVAFNDVSRDSQIKLKVSIYPNNALVDEEDIRWTVVGSFGSINKTNGLETTFTAGPIDSQDVNSGLVKVVAYVSDKGRTYSAECAITVEKAILVEDIKFSNVFNSEIYFDARDGLASYDSGVIADTRNNFEIVSNVYPVDAHNKRIRYIYDGQYDLLGRPVFVVSDSGIVQPVRGGVATLKIVPDDVYIDEFNYRPTSANLPRLIKIVVADGSSMETAYRITNAQDLMDIGSNKNAMNLYYVLANNIDLSSIKDWTPIGSYTLPFTGHLSGKYVVGYNNLEVNSKISGLNFKKVLSGSSDAYLGLFACVNLGQITDLKVEIGKVDIDATSFTGSLYFGGLSGVIRDSIDYTVDNSLNFSGALISNCSVYCGSDFDIKVGINSSYVGGMFGFVDCGVTIDLTSDETSVELAKFNISDNTGETRIGDLYVGGFAGLIQSSITYHKEEGDGTPKQINGYDQTNVTGCYDLSSNVDGEGNIIYSTYFKNSGLDVVIGDMNVFADHNSYIGGFVGYAKLNINQRNSDTVRTYFPAESAKGLFKIEKIAVTANINAPNSANVGGVVGRNEYYISDIYFTGSVFADENVGAIAGTNAYKIDKAVVIGDGEYIVKGNKNVGGLVGEQIVNASSYIHYVNDTYSSTSTLNFDAQTLFSYVSSSSSESLIKGVNGESTNIGTLVGYNDGSVIGCYSEIVSDSKTMIGGGNGSVNFSFIIGGTIKGVDNTTLSVSNSYYVDGDETDYDEVPLLNSRYENERIFVKPGSEIEVNSKRITIDADINNGRVIICRPNELPLYDVIYNQIDLRIKNTSDNFVKVDEDKIVLFYYSLDNEFESGLTSKTKYELRQIAQTLNVVNISSFLEVGVLPKPFNSVRFNVTSVNADGMGSPIITVNNNGTINVNREGLALLTITSVVNPSLTKTIQIYVTDFISELELYNGGNSNTVQLDNGVEIAVRKDYGITLYAKILSQYNNIVLKSNNKVGLRLEVTPKDDCTIFDENDTIVRLNQLSVNNKLFDARCYISVAGVKYYANMIDGQLVFDDIDPVVTIDSRLNKYKITYNGIDYRLNIEKAYIDIEDLPLINIDALKVFSNEIVVKPYLITEFKNASNNIVSQKLLLETSRINYKLFNISVYEGAINIETDIDGVLYSPSDTVNFEIYVISDNELDGVKYAINNQQYYLDGYESKPYLNISIYNRKVTQLDDGKYKIAYNVSVNLANVFEARYLEENYEYSLTFNSTLIEEVGKTITIEFAPQTLQRMEIVNYTNGEMMLDSSGETVKHIYNQNEATSLFISSNANGMLHINTYPYYSKVDYITIESVVVDNEYISFTQLVKQEDGTYVTLKPRSQYVGDGSTMILQKCSFMNNAGDKSFNGNFFVRTLISSELKEGTIMPVIVHAYKYDDNGELVLVKDATINLIVKEVPFIKVELNDATYSNYIARGTSQSIKVTVGKTLAGQQYSATVTVKDKDNNDIVTTTNELNTAIYTKSNSYTIEAGREVYIDSLYAGIALKAGTKIIIELRIQYEENGDSKQVASRVQLVVVDYLVEDVELYSFNNETNYLRMSQLQEYEFGISDVKFKSAPTYDMAINQYSFINSGDTDVKNEYNANYYGKVTNSENVYYFKKNVSKGSYYYYIVNANGNKVVEFSKYNFVFSVVGSGNNKTVQLRAVSDDESKSVEQVLGGYSIELGVEMLQTKFKEEIRYDSSLITQKVNDNTYTTLDTVENSLNSKFYVKSREEDGKNYLVGVVVGSNYGLKVKLTYSFGEVFVSENSKEQMFTLLLNPTTTENNKLIEIEKFYTFNIVTYSDLDIPLPIYTQAEFENMTAGEHYILMNNISLVSYKPISTEIASFDGNGYNIIMQSFDIAGSSEGQNVSLGLFKTVSENTILKNINLIIGGLKTIDVTGYLVANIGFIAVENNGKITNCSISYEDMTNTEVVSSLNLINGVDIEFRGKTIEIKSSTYVNGEEAELNVAGFVSTNNGSITNSRVGNLDDAITSFIQLKAKGNLAGFVNVNVGHISSSYVGNIYLINTNPNVTNSITAGFVGKNNSLVTQSYVKGCDLLSYNSLVGNTSNNANEIPKEDLLRSRFGALISNGNVGGFVYDNNGNIADCYSNIKLSSNARTAGFIFKNGSNGTVKTSYSASKVMENSALHMPFVGISDSATVQNEGLFENCYYLAMIGEHYDNIALGEGVIELSNNEFTNEQLNFNDFSFSGNGFVSNWDFKSYGPELEEANKIAESIRFANDLNGELIYTYLPKKIPGSKYNPYIISDAEEFNYYFNNNDSLKTDGSTDELVIDEKYYRIVGDINFDDVAGDNMTKNIMLSNVVIFGNDFTISNIRINSSNSSSQTDSIGLFRKIYNNSTIKDLSLSIAEANALNVNMLGGLAGLIEDSYLLNIDVSSDTVMQGYNLVGGLAGRIKGNGIIQRVNSSASVQAVYKSSDSNVKPIIYDGDNSIGTVSFAGAIAGVCDLTMDWNKEFEDLKRSSGANVQFVKVSGNVNVSAEYAGGLFGFVGPQTHVYDSLFELSYDDADDLQHINSTYCAGGIIAVNYGIVTQARITHSSTNQQLVDDAYKAYLANGTKGYYGKTNLFTGKLTYVGGIIGMNYGGTLMYSYSRADIIDPNINGDLNVVTEQFFGGLVGVTFNGVVESCYAGGNVVTKASNSSYAGGLIGRINFLEGQVLGSTTGQSVSAVSVESSFNELCAVNYFDYDLARIAFRAIDGGSVNTGVLFGYVSENVTNENFTFDKLHAISNILFKDKYLFKADDNNGKYTRKLVANLKSESVNLIVEVDNTALMFNEVFEVDTISVANQNNFFADLIARTDFWYKENGKMPKLRLGNILDEMEIYSPTQLLTFINIYPYKTFKIMNDLDFSQVDWTKNTYPNKTFTGKIVSTKTIDGSEEFFPVNFYNIDFNPMAQNENNTAIGFFTETKRATISNVNFFIKNADISNCTKTNVYGSVSASDDGSNFNNVHVIFVNEEINDSNVNGLTIGGLKTTASYVGGILGTSGGTAVFTNCSVTGNIEVVPMVSSTEYCLGGIVGKSQGLKMYNGTTFGFTNFTSTIQFGTYHYADSKYYFDENSKSTLNSLPTPNTNETYSSLKLNGCIKGDGSGYGFDDNYMFDIYVGGLVGFNSTLFTVNSAVVRNENSNLPIICDARCRYKYVGGLVGMAKSSTNIQSSIANVAISALEDSAILNRNALLNKNVSAYSSSVDVGGIAGIIESGVVSNVKVGSFSSHSTIDACANVSIRIGGLIGYASNVSMNKSSEQNNLSFVDITGYSTNRAKIGGAIGECYNALITTKLNRIFTSGTIKAYKDTGSPTAYTIFVGGIVGSNSLQLGGTLSSAATSLNNSYSDMGIDIFVKGNGTKSYAYVGGIVGHTLSVVKTSEGGSSILGNVSVSGTFTVNACTAGGFINVNVPGSIAGDGACVGGVAGEIQNDKIVNTTVLTRITKADYSKNSINQKDNANNDISRYKIGAVTGRLDKATGSGFVVDEVTGLKVDTGALMCGKDSLTGSDFTSMSYAEFIDKLSNGDGYTYIINFYMSDDITIPQGSVLSPIKVNTSSDIDLDKFNLLVKDISVTSTLGAFNGVLAGGYLDSETRELRAHKVQITTNSLFTSIGKNAIISNIAITNLNLNNASTWIDQTTKCSNGLLAITNNGVIHDIYATGYVSGANNNNTGVGGLVDKNNSLIYNAIVDVKVTGKGAIGEIVSSSNNATMLNSFALGEIENTTNTTKVGAVAGASTNSYYRYVNTATSVVVTPNTNLNSTNFGFVGTTSGDIFAYCTLDPQTVVRNEIATSNSGLRELSGLTYVTSKNATTSRAQFILLDSVADKTRNYCYPYFNAFRDVAKVTATLNSDNKFTSARINNYTMLSIVLHEDASIGKVVNLDNNIYNAAFSVKDATKHKWISVDFRGKFYGNNKEIYGIDISKSGNYTGFFKTITGNPSSIGGSEQTIISGLNLTVNSIDSITVTSKQFGSISSLNSTSNYAGVLAGVIGRQLINGQLINLGDVVIQNVNVSAISPLELTANMVGTFAGYIENATLNNCQNSNISVKAYNLYYFGQSKSTYGMRIKWAYAGGMAGYTNNVTFTNCTNRANVTSDNGFDGKQIASYAGGNSYTEKVVNNNGKDELELGIYDNASANYYVPPVVQVWQKINTVNITNQTEKVEDKDARVEKIMQSTEAQIRIRAKAMEYVNKPAVQAQIDSEIDNYKYYIIQNYLLPEYAIENPNKFNGNSFEELTAEEQEKISKELKTKYENMTDAQKRAYLPQNIDCEDYKQNIIKYCLLPKYIIEHKDELEGKSFEELTAEEQASILSELEQQYNGLKEQYIMSAEGKMIVYLLLLNGAESEVNKCFIIQYCLIPKYMTSHSQEYDGKSFEELTAEEQETVLTAVNQEYETLTDEQISAYLLHSTMSDEEYNSMPSEEKNNLAEAISRVLEQIRGEIVIANIRDSERNSLTEEKIQYYWGDAYNDVKNYYNEYLSDISQESTYILVTGDHKNGTIAPPVGGFVAFAVSSNFIGNTNTNITINAGHAGNGEDAPTGSGDYKGNNSINGRNGKNGADGGNAYIGGLVGIAKNNCQFDANTHNFDNITFTFDNNDHNHSTVAGKGGDGGDGTKGNNCCGEGCHHGPWITDNFSGSGPCDDVGVGGDGGNGGNGGVLYLGRLYGATDYDATYNISNNDADKSSKYSCSAGGQGGSGGEGGTGHQFKGEIVTEVVSTVPVTIVESFLGPLAGAIMKTIYKTVVEIVVSPLNWDHYGGNSGKNGCGGNNGNGTQATRVQSYNAYDGEEPGDATGKRDGAPSEYVYLQN